MSRKRNIIIALVVAAVICGGVLAAYKLHSMYRYLISTIETNAEAGREEVESVKSIVYNRVSYPNNLNYDWVDDNILIAHGMGGIEVNGEQLWATSTLEAFEENYALGHRVFEVDMQLTSDGNVACCHDWNTFKAISDASDIEGSLSLQQFKDAKVLDGALTQLTGEDLIELMVEYPDIYIVTDSKYMDSENVKLQFSQLSWLAALNGTPGLTDRFIVQIYNQDMLTYVQDVFPVKSIIYTLYQSPDTEEEVIEFCKNSGIKVVTMPAGIDTPEYVSTLVDIGVKVYTHSIGWAFSVPAIEEA